MTDHDEQLLHNAKALSSAPLVRDLLELIERLKVENEKLKADLAETEYLIDLIDRLDKQLAEVKEAGKKLEGTLENYKIMRCEAGGNEISYLRDIEKVARELREKVLCELEGQVPEFAKQVAPLYKQLGWKWGWCPSRIPTVQDIEECLKELIEGLKADENEPNWSTGGLCVSIKNRDGHITGTLEFTCTYHIWATPDGQISSQGVR